MRNLNEQEIRKLLKLNQSYALTLPVNDIRKLGWREKQKLIVKQIGDTLVISDWKKK